MHLRWGESNKGTKIIVVIIIGIILVLFVDHQHKKTYTDVYSVGREFAYSLMMKNSESMQTVATEELKRKIESLNYPKEGLFNLYSLDLKRKNMELASCSSFWSKVVATYRYSLPLENKYFLYTIVLSPTSKYSLWERARIFLYYDCPIIRNWSKGCYISSAKWLVSDFYTESDIEPLIEKALREEEKFNKLSEQESEKYMNQMIEGARSLPEEIVSRNKQLDKFTEKWSAKEKIEQYKRNKATYSVLELLEKQKKKTSKRFDRQLNGLK